MALLDNGVQINTVTLSFAQECSLDVGPLTDLMARWVTCVGLGNALAQPLGYIIVWVQVDWVQDYDEDQTALVIPDLSNFVVRVLCHSRDSYNKPHHECNEREGDRCLGNTMLVNTHVWPIFWWCGRTTWPTIEDSNVGEPDPNYYDNISLLRKPRPYMPFPPKLYMQRWRQLTRGKGLM